MAIQTPARPLQTLRQYVTDLEAAILLCLGDPAKKPVHRLRTTTRRIEAQLVLLSILRVPRVHGEDSRRAGRLLKKIRRAAGEVRDLDVQRDLIAANTPANSRDEARQLRNTLKQQRAEAAGKLLEVLDKCHFKLAEALESLLEIFEESEPLTIAPTELADLTVDWFDKNAPIEHTDPESLHSIRKKAKIARYLAENAPGEGRTPNKLAASFSALQLAGGEWHDWLILAGIARDELGESSAITEACTRQCQRKLASYRKRLTSSAPKAEVRSAA